jgi:hypothetical protein
MPPFLNPGRRRRAVLLAVPVLAAAAGLGVVTAVGSPAAASTATTSPCQPYQLPGGGEIIGMNDAGMYVGQVRDASGRHAAWWTHTGLDLGTGWAVHVPDIPAVPAVFLDVNASGVMSGYSRPMGKGFVYDSNTGDFTWLPDFGSGYDSWARRINASGVVSGSAVDDAGDPYAAIWRPPYTKAERVHAPGESREFIDSTGARYKIGSETDGINDQGTVAGYTFLGGPAHDVEQWARSKQWHDAYGPLNTAFTKAADGRIMKLPAGYDQALGFAINNAGLVVGASLRDPNAYFLPAYWRNGVEHDLGAPADAAFGVAYNVSQGGWATGGIELPDTIRSFVWTGTGTMQLNQPLPGYDGSWSHAVSDVLHQVAGSSGPLNNPTPTVWQCPADFSTG